MPIEIKKRLEKVSLNGMTSATIWLEYSDSEMASPAINAPMASERPKSEVNHAVPRHRSTIVRMNTSLLLSFTTCSKTLGMMKATPTTITAKAMSDAPRDLATDSTDAPELPPMV